MKNLLLSILGLLLALPGFARDFQYTYGGQTLTYTVIDATAKTCEISGHSNNLSGNLIIPAFAKDGNVEYTVTSIGNSAFNRCTALTSVVIPNSVTSIRWDAFYGCSGLKEISIVDGESTLEFGRNVFSGVEPTKLYLGRNFTYSGSEPSYAPFYNKSSLTELTIGNSVTSIDSYAFYGCSGLTSVAIPNSVTSIGEFAFSYCSGLTSVVISNSVTSIGVNAFSGCSGLTSVAIPNSVTSIGAGAFYGCSGLKEISIADGESTLEFGGEVFTGAGLTKLYLGRNFTYSGRYADKAPFYNMSSLTELTIGNPVTSIDSYAFRGCSGLKEISIADSESNLGFGERVFSGVEPTKLYLGRNFTYSGSEPSYAPFYNKSSLTELTIDNSVTSFDSYAFRGCSGLTSVVIPNSVISIGDEAFYGCSGLTSIVIPNSVTSVGEYAFEGCSGMTSAVIGNSVTSIGRGAFYGCSGLTSVVIPNSVTSIGGAAFRDCSGLTSVVIPNSVTSIGEAAFHDCSGLKEISIADGESTLEFGSFAFSGTKLTNLYLGRNYSHPYMGSLFDYHLTELTIGNSVTSINSYAFWSCSGLTSIVIPNSVTYIGASAFEGCSGLTSVTIGNSVTSIGWYAFRGCTNLTSVTIGNSVTSIGENAFDSSNITKMISNAEVAPKIATNTFSPLTRAYCNVEIPESSSSSYQHKWACFNCFASIMDDDNVIRVSSPGNLINQIDINNVNRITKLKLIGRINGTDLLTLNKCPNIVSLDLSEATIVSGGMPYYEEDNIRFGTKDNTLGEKWCYNLSSLITVKLPLNLTTIEKNAFSRKSDLLSIEIPGSVTSIGDGAFKNCSSLIGISIADGESTLHFGERVFDGNVLDRAQPAKLYLGRNISYYGNSSIFGNTSNAPFYNMSSLTELTIGNSVTYIGVSAFEGCSGLTSVAIPNSVTSIGASTFRNCSGLTSVTIGNSVTSIGESAFDGCENLSSINIPDPIQTIGSSAFYNCSSLTSVVLPGSLRKIGNKAFAVCSSLTTVEIINPIPPVIESGTFWNAANINLYIPEDSRIIYWLHPYWSKFKSLGVRGGEDDLTFTADNVTYRVTSETDHTVEVTAVALAGRSAGLDIPAEVELDGQTYRVAGIANHGFENVAVASVSLRATIGYVGLEAFKGCGALRTVNCNAMTPPSVSDNSFDESTYTAAALNVPEQAVDAYKAHDVWGKFNVGSLGILVERIVLNPTAWTGVAGETFNIAATVYPADARNRLLAWSSSDESIAMVSAEGKVTALKTGLCEITAKATDGSAVAAVCTVNVTMNGGVDDVLVENSEEMTVYNLNGILIMTTTDQDSLNDLAPGLYIVRQGANVRKLVVR